MFSVVYKNSSKTFVLTFRKTKNIPEKIISNIMEIYSLEKDKSGPWLGIHDLYFCGTMTDWYTYSYSGKSLFLEGNELAEQTNFDKSIPVKEIEVYQIIFKY